MNIKPSTYTREQQVAYAVKQMRKARAALANAARGLPEAWAAELIRVATQAAETGSVAIRHEEAVELIQLSRETYYASAARRAELSKSAAKRDRRHQLAIEARRKYR